VTTGNLRNAQIEAEFWANGATTHRASPGRLNLMKGRSFKSFLSLQRFDVVMTLTGLFGAYSLRLAKSAGVPMRIAWHRRSSPAYAPTWSRRAYARWARWQLERSSTCVLSNSEAALDRFHGRQWRDQPNFRVIHNGVDPKRFYPRPAIRGEVRRALGLPKSATVVGHVGRFDPAKDHETLFRSLQSARKSGVNAWLVCAGTGTDSDEFRRRVEVYRLADVSRCLGARSDIEHLHQAMDVFLFPSLTEGQPNALIEAMLGGVPILASDIPPIREAVPEFFYKNLFLPGDATSIAERLGALAGAEATGTESARAWAMNRYDPQRNFDALLEIMGA
jgi:glycosyltransferase involved in cell wall biosynthesis